MPEVTDTAISANYGLFVQANGTASAGSVTPAYREGLNDNHKGGNGWRFYFPGPNHTVNPLSYDPVSINKVEVRWYVGDPQSLAGNVPHVDSVCMLVPAHNRGVGASATERPHAVYSEFASTAANNQWVGDLIPAGVWPSVGGYTDWFEIDDGTDLRSAIATRANYYDATDNAGGAYVDLVFIIMGGNSGLGQQSTVYNYQSANPPQIRITYNDLSPVILQNSLSSSTLSVGGGLKARSHEAFGRWHGDQPEELDKEPLMPGLTAGSGDLPITGIRGAANPNGYDWAVWANAGGAGPADVRPRLLKEGTAGIAFPTGGSLGRPKDNYAMYLEGYLSRSGYIQYDVNRWRSRSDKLSTASGRFQVKFNKFPDAADPHPSVFIAYKNGSPVWEFQYQKDEGGYSSNHVRILNYVDGNTVTPWSSYRFSVATHHHWEFQVSNDVPGSEIIVRVYDEGSDETGPPDVEFTLPCSDVTFDEIEFCNEFTAFTHTDGVVNVAYQDVDLWDDYYLDGFWKDSSNYGRRYEFIPWQEFEYDGADWNPIDFYGEVTQVSPLVINTSYDFDKLRDFESERWPYDGDTTASNHIWTKTENASYAHAGALNDRQYMDIYVPNTPTPPGGRKVFLYLHGGFFVSGTENQIPQGLIADLILKEYVVCSLQIRLSSADPLVNRALYINESQTPVSYPDWHINQDTARHPTQILDVKQAVAWLQESTQRINYGLSGEVVTGGHSAGGYPAVMAMLTKDVVTDPDGISYRLQDHTVDYSFPNIPDPDILGCYVWSAPTKFETLIDYDPTGPVGAPEYPLSNTGHPTMWFTMLMYFGLNNSDPITQNMLDGASMDWHIANQSLSNLKPIGYSGGKTDYLVPAIDVVPTLGYAEGQATHIESAYAARGISDRFTKVLQSETQHYQSPYRYDPQHLEAFLNSL